MSSLGSLYKAAPLPTDIQKKIIDFVRKEKEFEIMSYLAECPGLIYLNINLLLIHFIIFLIHAISYNSFFIYAF